MIQKVQNNLKYKLKWIILDNNTNWVPFVYLYDAGDTALSTKI